ncbi:hypothetical protein UlMin_006042 [Ulmus minor]
MQTLISYFLLIFLINLRSTLFYNVTLKIFLNFVCNFRDEDQYFSMDIDSIRMRKLMESANIGKDPSDFLEEDIVGVEFKSVEEAESFYHIYSKIIGFSVRKNQCRKNQAGFVTTQSWCCSNEGFKRTKYIKNPNKVREPRSEIRIGCRAMFRVCYSKITKLWVVKEFRANHNHCMVTDMQKHFLRSHRKISAAELEQAKLLKKAGVKTSEIWNLFVPQNGGWDKVGCTKKYLYNSLAAGRRGVDDLDANTTLTFLQSKLDIRIHGQ